MPTMLHMVARHLPRRLKTPLKRVLGFDRERYPARPAGLSLDPSERHEADYCALHPALSHRGRAANIEAWQDEAHAALSRLMGYAPPVAAPEPLHGHEFTRADGLVQRHFYLRLNPGHDLPVRALWQKNPSPLPALICLQGTNSGAHLSVGETIMPDDGARIARGGDYAVQAAREGYLALAMEQSCFGERRERRLAKASADPCIDTANHALLLGRTLLAERVGDVAALAHWLRHHGQNAGLPADAKAGVRVMGQSSGGMVALFVTALQNDIAAALVAGSVGFIAETIARRGDGSGQNVIPGFLRDFELDDVVALCAPRPLLVLAGRHDHIWPYEGAARVVNAAHDAYAAFGAGHRLMAVEGPEGHRFYPALAWPAFRQITRA